MDPHVKRQLKRRAELMRVEALLRKLTTKIEELRDSIIVNSEDVNSPSVLKIACYVDEYNRLDHQRKFLIRKLS